MGTARAPVVGSGSAPAWIWRVSKPHCSLMARQRTPSNSDRTGRVCRRRRSADGRIRQLFALAPRMRARARKVDGFASGETGGSGVETGGSGVEAGGGRALDDLDAVLVLGAHLEVDEIDAVLLADRGHRRRRREGVAGPHLVGEAHAVLDEHPVADVVGEQPARGAHREHPVGEHARVAGDLGGEDLVGVQRVVVTGGPGVLHDLGAGQVVGDDLGGRVADLHVGLLQAHRCPPQASTTRSVRTPTPRAVMTSSPFWSRYSVMVSLKTSLPERLPSFSHVLPGLTVPVSTSPGRMWRWYVKCCSAWRPPPPPPPLPPEPSLGCTP